MTILAMSREASKICKKDTILPVSTIVRGGNEMKSCKISYNLLCFRKDEIPPKISKPKMSIPL